MTRGRGTLHGNPGSAVYGTILVAAQLAIEGATGENLGTVAIIGSLASTVVVFWLAHAYTDTLGSVLAAEPGAPRPTLLGALRSEWPIVESAVVPIVVLGGVDLAGGGAGTGVLVALVLADLELVGWAALAGRRAGQTGVRLIGFAVLAGVLGLALIGLKYAIH